MRGAGVAEEKPEPDKPPEPPQEITCSGGLTIRKPGAGNGQ